MANAKEIRTKIKSIQSTQKITRAMEMVAASKMKKAQDRMRSSRPYYEQIKYVIENISEGRLEYVHPYTINREINRVGYIIISTDKGLCGGLNINLFKKVLHEMSVFQNNNIEIDVCLIGNKASSFFNRIGSNITARITNLGDRPVASDFLGIIKLMLKSYDENKIDRLYLVYNKFINSMTQNPKIDMILPVLSSTDNDKIYWDYIYEPSAQLLLESLLKRYIESIVYQGLVENIACEQASRMVAMKSASDNAEDLIDEFKLMYNKARQSAITQELSEIVAGAAAV